MTNLHVTVEHGYQRRLGSLLEMLRPDCLVRVARADEWLAKNLSAFSQQGRVDLKAAKRAACVVAAVAPSRISPDGVWRFSVENAVKPATYWTLLDGARARSGAEEHRDLWARTLNYLGYF